MIPFLLRRLWLTRDERKPHECAENIDEVILPARDVMVVPRQQESDAVVAGWDRFPRVGAQEGGAGERESGATAALNKNASTIIAKKLPQT